MKTSIKDILNDMIATLEELSNEKLVLQKMYKEYYSGLLKDKSESDRDFYSSLIDMSIDYINIEDFEPNDMMRYLYKENLEKISELENYALKMYKLYTEETNDKITYMEELKSTKVQEMEILQTKDWISVNEFELLFSYGSTAQKGFRSRLRDPIPFEQKSIGSKILYEKNKVVKWLKTNK